MSYDKNNGHDNHKKKTWIGWLKELINKEPTNIYSDSQDANIPLGDGNLWATTQYLQSVLEKSNIGRYNLLLDAIRSVRNIYWVKNDELLQKSWQNILTVFLVYGGVAVRIKKTEGQKLQIYGIMNYELDDDLSIKKANGYFPTVLNRGYIYGFDEKKSKMISLNNSSAVFATYGSEGLSIITRLNWLINARYRTLKMIGGNVVYHNKRTKIKFGGGNSEEIKLQIQSAISDNSKFLLELNPELDLSVTEDDNLLMKGKKKTTFGKKIEQSNPTIFEPMMERNNVNEDGWKDYSNFTKLQNEIAGVRFNNAEKPSRNTDDDVKNSVAKTHLIELDLKQSLQIFLNDWNKMYKRNATLSMNLEEELQVDEPQNEKEGNK